MTQIKICGITNHADAQVAVDAGANLLGFIFYPKSPRYVTPARVREIVQSIRSQRTASDTTPARFVGVFVHESPRDILNTLDQAEIDYAQLHSDEPPSVLQQLQGRAFKALRPQSTEEARRDAEIYATLGPNGGPRWMIDAYDPAAYGGTGHKADWRVAAELAQRYPGLLLAGGLTLNNVAEAMQTVRPWGVDVSSGVEAAPGRKDHAKVRAFIDAVRAAT